MRCASRTASITWFAPSRILREDLKRDDVHAVFVGGGPEQPLIRAYADEQGVGDLCTFTGRVSDDDLCRILSSADVAVDPDPKTAWSDQSTMNKIMEYMFFGLPIVCYDLTEHKVSATGRGPLCGGELGTGTGGWHQRSVGRSRTPRAHVAIWCTSGCARSSVWQHSVPPSAGCLRRDLRAVRSRLRRRRSCDAEGTPVWNDGRAN